jgi:hypothetical protein
MLLSFLQTIPDARRKQSQQFPLSEMLAVVIIWVIGWSTSYRELESYITSNFEDLKELLSLKRKRKPDYSTIRNIMISCNSERLEQAMRLYTERLIQNKISMGKSAWVSIDGKTMRWSFDAFTSQNAFHILSVYLSDKKIVVWHEIVETDKTNEIPKAQKIIGELWLKGVVYTLDALHCQKKH